MSSRALPTVIALAAAPAAPNPSASSPTAELTRRMEAGDELAWREFHAAYAGRLQRYLLVVCCGDEEAAAEAGQQTFLRAVKHLRICNTEAELWSWLALLARSAAADACRRQRRYIGFIERWFRFQSDSGAASHDSGDELKSSLAIELAALPDADRDLIEQKYFAGDSVRDLAIALGTSEKAVESRLTRARQKLKSALLNRLRHEERA